MHCCATADGLRLTVGGSAPRRKLPEDQAEGVHVDAQEGVALEVDGALKDFRSHVAPCSHLQVQSKVKGQHAATHRCPYVPSHVTATFGVNCTCPCVSPADSPASNCRASPKSAIQAVRLLFSSTFLLLMSLKYTETGEKRHQPRRATLSLCLGDFPEVSMAHL